jgi:hypothetical protein
LNVYLENLNSQHGFQEEERKKEGGVGKKRLSMSYQR